MVKYSEPLMKKRLSGESLSEAKVKALKWIGKYVMCKKEAHDIMYYFEEDKENENCIVVTLFVALDEPEVLSKHCAVCKEFHKLFYINENFNCNECRARAFHDRLAEMIKIKKSYYRGELKKMLEEEQ